MRDACAGVVGHVATLAHGTTVATNALLERTLGRVALVTTRGFADVIEIARQARPSLYDARVDRPPALVPRERRFEVAGRLDARGGELEPFDAVVPDLGPVDAVAVCLLHADLDPTHERAVAAVLRARGITAVVCSHEVSPEYREYERTVTTVADAALAPVCAAYLRSLASLADDVLVMTSGGGLVPLADAAAHPAHLLLSGPAAGVRAAAAVAAACGWPDAVSFDMGGTSTDVCLVRGGVPAPTATRRVAGLPVRLPALAVHTIGAGGGSIAGLDPGGALVVGPRSAGARPGPACYGTGGLDATVTDADLVLGRLPADTVLPGIGRLDADAARAALTRAGVTAEGVVAVVDAAMERAVRVVTVEQGVDPRAGAGRVRGRRAVARVRGGGAARHGHGDRARRAGVFSAVGLVCSPEQRELVRSWATPASTDGLAAARAELAAATAALVPGGEVEGWLDCRYVGQSHELTVREPADFPGEHERRNGFARPGAPVEVVALRARVTHAAPLALADLPTVRRARVVGPAVVAEVDCTMWVPAGWVAEPGPTGAWLVQQR